MGLLSFIFNAKKYKKNDEVCSQSSEKILKNGLFGREIYWFDVVSYLEQGGDITVCDDKGNTLAHKYPMLATVLMEKGMDMNKFNDEGDTPAMVAARRGDLSEALVMATSKENLNRIYSDGTTILTAYLSQIIFFDKKVLRVLLEKGANPNQKNAKDQTPFDCIKSYRNSEVLPELLSYGLDVENIVVKGLPFSMWIMREKPAYFLRFGQLINNAKDEMGNTLLHVWATDSKTYSEYSESIFERLIKQIDINVQNNAGQTPLMLALQKGKYTYTYMCHDEQHCSMLTREDEVKKLLENGADVRLADNEGNTALHYAAKAGLAEMVDVLVKAGAQAWVVNKEGKLPSDYAKGIAHSYLKMIALSCSEDYRFHSGFVYNPEPQIVASQPVVGQVPNNQQNNQNTIE